MTTNADLLIAHPLVPLLRERLSIRGGGQPPFKKFIFGLPDRVATNKASLTKSVVLKKLITGTIYIKADLIFHPDHLYCYQRNHAHTCSRHKWNPVVYHPQYATNCW